MKQQIVSMDALRQRLQNKKPVWVLLSADIAGQITVSLMGQLALKGLIRIPDQKDVDTLFPPSSRARGKKKDEG